MEDLFVVPQVSNSSSALELFYLSNSPSNAVQSTQHHSLTMYGEGLSIQTQQLLGKYDP